MWYYKLLMLAFLGTIVGQIIRVKVILARRRKEKRMKPREEYTEKFLTHEFGYERIKRNLKKRAKEIQKNESKN